MIPTPETNQDKNTALFLMATLSPKVKDTVDLELYRQNADSDGSTEQYVIDNAFTSLVQDLGEIGLELTFDYSETTEEMGTLFAFLHLASYLLPNSLYDVLKTDTLIRQCVEHIVQGSLGDNETAIQTYLSELGGLDGQPALVPEIHDLIDQYYPYITQNDQFTDYLRNLVDLASSEKLTVESDAESHQLFRDKARSMIARMSDAVNLFSTDPVYPELCRVQDGFIKDLVAPQNFLDYAYLFTNERSTIPDDLVSSYDDKWYHYKVSHPWSPEYFTIRNLTLTIPQVMIMYSFIYACNDKIEGYTKDAERLRQTIPLPIVEQRIAALYQE